MAITRRTHGAATAWTTSQPIPYSTSATAGDVCYLIGENTATIGSAPAGWTEIASGTANGYNLKIFKKDTPYAGGDGLPTITASGGSGGVAWIEHYYSSTGGMTIEEGGAQVGLDTTTGSTAFSATGSSITTANGDWLVGFMGLKSSATMSANPSSIVLTQASATLGTAVGRFGARLSGASPTNSLYYNCYTRPVTTGATGAMTYSCTGGSGAANVAGPAGLMRLREVSSGINYTPSQDDPAAVTDTTAPVVAAERAPSDAAGVTDAATAATGYDRTVGDPVGVTDSGAPQTIEVATTVPDPLGVTDTASAAAAIARTPADPVGATDTTTAATDAERGPTDAAAVTDAVSAVMARVVTVDDFLSLTDNTTTDFVGSGAASVSDPAGVTDATTTQQTASRAPTDGVGATDAATAQNGLTRAPADAAGVTDAITVVMARVVTVADLLSLADGASADLIGDGVAQLDDGATVTDQPAAALDRPRGVADPAGASDSAVAVLERVTTAADPVSVSDVVESALVRVVALSDALGVVDTAQGMAGLTEPAAYVTVAHAPPPVTVAPGGGTTTTAPEAR